VVTTLRLFSDYEQIHLLDGASQTDPNDAWMDPDGRLPHHLALAEDAVAVRTGLNGYMTVVVEVSDGPPGDDPAGSADAVECSLRVDSGVLVVTSPTYGEDDGDRIAVPAGWLRLRIRWSRSYEDPPGEDEPELVLRIQCWPAGPSAARSLL
jgi:hypothetical protein